jgi:hypothetical protein
VDDGPVDGRLHHQLPHAQHARSPRADCPLKDLDITTQQYSWIVIGFQGAIMLQPICRYVIDTIGLRLGFAIFATARSFICMAHGSAGNWQTLFGIPPRAHSMTGVGATP